MQKTLSLPNLQRIALLAKKSRPVQILAIILVYRFGSIVAWAHDIGIALPTFTFVWSGGCLAGHPLCQRIR